MINLEAENDAILEEIADAQEEHERLCRDVARAIVRGSTPAERTATSVRQTVLWLKLDALELRLAAVQRAIDPPTLE